MEIGFQFRDIFDIDELQELMRSLSNSLEVGLAIRSPQGERYTEDCDYCELCRKIKQSPIGCERCEQSDEILSAYKPVSPFICNCRSAGLVDAGINIMIGEVHIASILVGQVRVAEYEHTEEEYRGLARELGIDEGEYMEALSQVPRKTKKQLDSILETLTLVARQLSQLGYRNLYQKSIIDSMMNHEQALKKEKQILENLAERDALTGLYNRRKIEDIMAEAEKEEASKNPVIMVSIDVNNLKLTNDVFGHKAGDQMLQVVAKYLENLAGPGWIVARCGGDEFRLLVPGDVREQTVLNYCERALHNCHRDSSLNIPASFSYGIARRKEGERLYDCFKRADEDMYERKNKMQEKQKFPDYILEKLYDRNILNRELVEATIETVGRFGAYLGYDQEMIERLKTVVLYQDLGMAQIPERLMIKESARTEETWKYLHAHPVEGNLLARQFEKTYKVADIILQTHEAWDGNGYPNGLKGEEICLEARIVRVVDSYSFWVSPANETKKRTPEEVRQRILQYKGQVFDPVIAERFIEFLSAQGNQATAG